MTDPAPGRLITLEGGEGAGKSTQAARLAAALEAAGQGVDLTREPGGTPAAEAIRALVLHAAWDGGAGRTVTPDGRTRVTAGWDPLAEAMLHFAARREHWVGRIAPALAQGRWVVCDRFADSTWAYQGAAGLARDHHDALLRLVLGRAAPDLTLILDIDPAIGLARVAARGALNRYEAQDPAFHARVRATFLAIAAAEPARCAVIDAGRDADTVAAAIAATVRTRLGPP